MAKVQVQDRAGKKVGELELDPGVFDVEVNVPAMHQVVTAGLAAQRAGTHSTKTRAEVSGGGRKPWRQKGTGRARHGSNRSPIWVGGGVAHGPKTRDHSFRVPKKMKRLADFVPRQNGGQRSLTSAGEQHEMIALVPCNAPPPARSLLVQHLRI